jgi:hypothetical protein
MFGSWLDKAYLVSHCKNCMNLNFGIRIRHSKSPWPYLKLYGLIRAIAPIAN